MTLAEKYLKKVTEEGGDYDDIDGYLVEPREVVTTIYEKVKE